MRASQTKAGGILKVVSFNNQQAKTWKHNGEGFSPPFEYYGLTFSKTSMLASASLSIFSGCIKDYAVICCL